MRKIFMSIRKTEHAVSVRFYVPATAISESAMLGNMSRGEYVECHPDMARHIRAFLQDTVAIDKVVEDCRIAPLKSRLEHLNHVISKAEEERDNVASELELASCSRISYNFQLP